MQVKYKLQSVTLRGNMTAAEPVLIDVDSEVELSFFLSSGALMSGNYYAVITDSAGREHKVKLDNGKAPLPDWLKRPQILMLYVVLMEGNTITKRWQCQNLRISRLDDLSKLKFEAGADYEQLAARVLTLEDIINTQAEAIGVLTAQNEAKTGQIEQLAREISEMKAASNVLSEALSEA